MCVRKAVASKLHGVEVEISVVKRKGEQLYDDNDLANNSSDTDTSTTPPPPPPPPQSHNTSNNKKFIRNILHHSNSNAICPSRNNEKLTRSSNSLESQSNDNCNTIITSSSSSSTTPTMAKPLPRKKEVELSDHVQFLITEKNPHQTCSADDVVVREPFDEGDVITEGMYLSGTNEQQQKQM